MKPRFDDWSIFEYGFDGSCTPSFQMIPHGDIRSVWLYDSDGMDVKSVVPGIVGIEELASPTKNLRIFKLKGLMAGRTFVEVRKNSTLMTRLEAVVAPEIFYGEFQLRFRPRERSKQRLDDAAQNRARQSPARRYDRSGE